MAIKNMAIEKFAIKIIYIAALICPTLNFPLSYKMLALLLLLPLITNTA